MHRASEVCEKLSRDNKFTTRHRSLLRYAHAYGTHRASRVYGLSVSFSNQAARATGKYWFNNTMDGQLKLVTPVKT